MWLDDENSEHFSLLILILNEYEILELKEAKVSRNLLWSSTYFILPPSYRNSAYFLFRPSHTNSYIFIYDNFFLLLFYFFIYGSIIHYTFSTTFSHSLLLYQLHIKTRVNPKWSISMDEGSIYPFKLLGNLSF